MNNEKPILLVKNLSVTYNNGAGIKNINFNIYPGDFVALVGSNGAGKSTLLNGLSGIQEITEGTIIYHDQYINPKNPYRILGFSPQNQVIDWYLNVFDNVLLGPLLAGFDKKRSEEMTLKALNKVNLQQNIFSECLHFQSSVLSPNPLFCIFYLLFLL
ncbi:ATP-binding cassette domain-containing protein [Fervidibacillus halotolerans]|uniref:ATP-binding cassette domain-containing protein n=1 Tax=Fervidibacillus halotolerans TaxID=2980027 RepID=A0A9E8RXX0_9BACI|nr:ATP-binding cassette domain-containing protein [Fervidibacillus halotolerans]WAA13200.1 ATP-binding cassette domain-containing protein [Fervidibacillus halotolerans]